MKFVFHLFSFDVLACSTRPGLTACARRNVTILTSFLFFSFFFFVCVCGGGGGGGGLLHVEADRPDVSCMTD